MSREPHYRRMLACLVACAISVLCGGEVARAETPALVPLAGAFVTAGPQADALFTDGVRFASFADGAGRLVTLDAQTNRRSTVPASRCGPPSAMSPVFAPIAVAAGRLIAYCYVGPGASPTHEYRLYSLRSPPGHGRVVRFAPSLSIPGASLSPTLPVSVGAQWVEELGGGDGVHTTYSQAGSALFNLVSGAVLTPLPTLSAREYFDLSAPTVVRRLCAPVTTDNMPGADPLSAYSGWSTVVAFDRPWVVLERPDATLLAWRCGSPAPIRIGSDLPGHAQFATGILSWVAPDGSVDAENLANRRRLTWPARPTTSAATSIAYAEALHTAQRIFVVPQPFQGVPPTRAEPVYTASLGALYRR